MKIMDTTGMGLDRDDETPRVGAMRVVREDQYNWTTERYSEIVNSKTKEVRYEWKTVGYFGDLGQACKKALMDGAGGSNSQEIIDSLDQSLKDIKKWSKTVAQEVVTL
jgi:hypothetical protein